MGLKDVLREKRVYVDANIFIYLLEGNEEFEIPMKDICSLLMEDKVTIVSSDLVYTEILAHKALVGKKERIEEIVEFIGNFEINHISKDITIHAGILRGETGMKTPDALHVASAHDQKCDILLTNDSGIHVPETMKRVLISDYR